MNRAAPSFEATADTFRIRFPKDNIAGAPDVLSASDAPTNARPHGIDEPETAPALDRLWSIELVKFAVAGSIKNLEGGSRSVARRRLASRRQQSFNKRTSQ